MSSAAVKQNVFSLHGNLRFFFNSITVISSFILSIMVINNYNQCDDGKGYPTSGTRKSIVNGSYILAIIMLIVTSFILAVDIYAMVG